MILLIVLWVVAAAGMGVLYFRAMYWKELAGGWERRVETWRDQAEGYAQELNQLRQRHIALKEKHGSLIHSLHELAPKQTQWEIDADAEHKQRQKAEFMARIEAEIKKQCPSALVHAVSLPLAGNQTVWDPPEARE